MDRKAEQTMAAGPETNVLIGCQRLGAMSKETLARQLLLGALASGLGTVEAKADVTQSVGGEVPAQLSRAENKTMHTGKA